MKPILAILGVLAMLTALLWIGQGLGIVRWPASSFMIDQPHWSWRGLGLAGAGVALFLWSRWPRGSTPRR